MISLEACEPYFKYVQRNFELNPDTRQLVASQLSEITFPKKHVIYSEGDGALFTIRNMDAKIKRICLHLHV